MRKLIVVLVSVWANCSLASAGEPYAVANIPAHLMKDASVVKRIEEIRYEITEKKPR